MIGKHDPNHFTVIPNAKSLLGGFVNYTVTKYIVLVAFKDMRKKNFGNHIREKNLCIPENKLLHVCV